MPRPFLYNEVQKASKVDKVHGVDVKSSGHYLEIDSFSFILIYRDCVLKSSSG